MRLLCTTLFVIAGLINLAPIVGVLSEHRLESLYGVALEGPDLVVLMRHRAVTIALVGGLLLTSAFRPALRGVATVLGAVSMVSYLAIALSVGGYNTDLQTVFNVDVAGVVALAGGAALHFGRREGSAGP